MHLALLLTLAALPSPGAEVLRGTATLQDEVCPELRPILPDLLRIDRVQGPRHRHVVSDARVRRLEDELGRYLGLPATLRVKLTTISGHRREVAKNGSITAWMHHRASDLPLGYARIAWTGESVDIGSVHFRKEASRPEFDMDDLPVFHRRLGELLELVDPSAPELQGRLSCSSGSSISSGGVAPGFRVTLALRVPCERGEVFLSVPVTLPLDEGVAPFAGPADRPMEARRALDVGLELVARLEFDFPHSMQLRHSTEEPLAYELSLDPYAKEHPPLPVRVRIHRAEADAAWRVTEPAAGGGPSGVDLRAFVALANRVQGILTASESRLSVLGLAPGEAPEVARALLVTTDAESIWVAERARVTVLSVDDAGEAVVVERSELTDIRAGVPAGNVREAVSTTGEEFHLFVPVRGEIFMANPPPRVLRYGGRAFVPVGGRLSD